jgi:hypothetical protein
MGATTSQGSIPVQPLHVLNYYTYNADTLWIMSMVIVMMIGSIVFMKLVVWNAIYRHHGACYPLGAILGTHCIDRGGGSAKESFVSQGNRSTDSALEGATTSYPSLNHIVLFPLLDLGQQGIHQGRALGRRLMAYWRQMDRCILDAHAITKRIYTMFYDEYIRSYLYR